MTVIETEVQNLSGLAFTPDGRGIIAIGTDGSGEFSVPDGSKLRRLDVTSARRVWFDGDTVMIGRMAFPPGATTGVEVPADGPEAKAESADGRVRVCMRTETIQVEEPRRDRRGRHQRGGRTINTHVMQTYYRVADEWVQRWEVRSEDYGPDSAALSADGRELVTGRRYGDDLRLWDAVAGTARQTLTIGKPVEFRFHDSHLLAFCRSHLYIWDTTDWDRPPLTIYGGPHERLDDLAVHPDGRRAFLTNFARTVLVVDLPSGTVATTMDWGVPLLSRVAVSPDGTLAAAANHGGQVVLWDLDS